MGIILETVTLLPEGAFAMKKSKQMFKTQTCTPSTSAHVGSTDQDWPPHNDLADVHADLKETEAKNLQKMAVLTTHGSFWEVFSF